MVSGITSESQTYDELVAGPVQEFYGTIDAAATCAIGQVLEFDTTGNNWINYTSGSAKPAYAVCAEAKTLSADTRCRMIVGGCVRKDKLDSTAQADAEIEGALIGSGIIPLTGN